MNWIESHRKDLMGKAMAEEGILGAEIDSSSIPSDRRLAVRDRLTALLETEIEVCARDAIRIADAWTRGKEAPTEWRHA